MHWLKVSREFFSKRHGFQHNHMNEFRKSYFFVVYVLTYYLCNPLKLAEVFSKDGMSFLASCQNLVPRPWVIDDLEAFKVKWIKNSWKKASFLCINRHKLIWIVEFLFFWPIFCIGIVVICPLHHCRLSYLLITQVPILFWVFYRLPESFFGVGVRFVDILFL